MIVDTEANNHTIGLDGKESKFPSRSFAAYRLQVISGLFIAGKMHGAGVNEPVVEAEVVKNSIDAGCRYHFSSGGRNRSKLR